MAGAGGGQAGTGQRASACGLRRAGPPSASRRHPAAPRASLAAPLVALALAASPARAADPLTYRVSIAPTGVAALDAALAGSSQAISLRKRAPAGPFAIIGRLRGDLPRLRTALDSFGYFDAQPSVTLAGEALDAPGLAPRLEALDAKTVVPARITVALGPRYQLRSISLTGQMPPGMDTALATALALPTPRPYTAAEILQGVARLRTALAEAGYPFADVSPPQGVLDPAAHSVAVSIALSSGPRVHVGQITYDGLARTNAAYVYRRLLLHRGDLFTPNAIEAARQDLAATGVFAGVRATAAKTLAQDGTLPLTLSFTERKLHAVSADLSFATDTGGELAASWTHRNLFGNAEALTATLGLNGLGGSAAQGIGYNGKLTLVKPDFYRRDQALELSVQAVKQSLQAYDQTAVILGGVVTRKLSRRLSLSAGLGAVQEKITQQGDTRDYTLLAVPLSLRYDTTDLANPLDDPTRGWRSTLSIAPTQSLGASSATFVVLQGTAAGFVDASSLGLSRSPGRSVLALRALLGSAQGASAFDLPPDQRFYGGGSATVRGYRYQSIGPQFANGDPQGGAAIAAATVELRQRVWRDIGMVAFVDAGQVSHDSSPMGGALEEGAGIGLRYYTPIGPVRVDIAVPMKKRANTDAFQLYLGLGQAF